MTSSNHQTEQSTLVSWGWVEQAPAPQETAEPLHAPMSSLQRPSQPKFDLLRPLRNWFDDIPVHNAQMAHLICRFVPSQCPFERDVALFGRVLFHIPPLCKLNPLYDQFVGLRFRALCYLVDVCGEDARPYC